jgi:hypothetical protein
MNENMKEATIHLDLEFEVHKIKGILVDEKHFFYAFDNSILFAPNVKKEGNHYYSDEGAVQIGEINSVNITIEYLKKIVEKIKTTSLFDYIISNEDVLSLDFDFGLTEK